jgi:hypothetical protein
MKLLFLLTILPLTTAIAYASSWVAFIHLPEKFKLVGTMTAVIISDLIVLFIVIAGQIKVFNELYERKEKIPKKKSKIEKKLSKT